VFAPINDVSEHGYEGDKEPYSCQKDLSNPEWQCLDILPKPAALEGIDGDHLVNGQAFFERSNKYENL
jgi:hypothetical protein